MSLKLVNSNILKTDSIGLKAVENVNLHPHSLSYQISDNRGWAIFFRTRYNALSYMNEGYIDWAYTILLYEYGFINLTKES